MKTFIDSEQSEIRIDIIPLVDVIFCILAFFMLAAFGLTRFQEGIGINLPQTRTPTGAQFGSKLPLQINAVGQVFLNNTGVTEQQLIENLTNYRRQNPTGLIIIEADSQVRYERVIQILDLLTELGINRVSMGTETAAPTQNAPQNPFAPPNLNPSFPGLEAPGTEGPGIPPAGQPPLSPLPPTNATPAPNSNSNTSQPPPPTPTAPNTP